MPSMLLMQAESEASTKHGLAGYNDNVTRGTGGGSKQFD
jgi:hypothetical protein